MAQIIEVTDLSRQNGPEKGILSQTLLKNNHTSMVYMQLAPGEELNEHTSKFPVWIHTIGGEGKMQTPGGEVTMKPGEWIYLEPSEEHAVHPAGQELLRFILIVMKQA
jgi:quercetin dioxygenase-like cupin family protein